MVSLALFSSAIFPKLAVVLGSGLKPSRGLIFPRPSFIKVGILIPFLDFKECKTVLVKLFDSFSSSNSLKSGIEPMPSASIIKIIALFLSFFIGFSTGYILAAYDTIVFLDGPLAQLVRAHA